MITAVRVLRGVHGHSELLLRLLLLGKLEGVDLGRNTAHGATGRERVDLSELLRLEQAHVDILLVCRSDLLLLLLKQLDLLLDRQLFHHQRGQLRRTSPMSDMELAPSRAWHPGLALLIHDPKRDGRV